MEIIEEVERHLAVLSDDYLSVPDERLPDVKVSMTMVGGRVVHERV